MKILTVFYSRTGNTKKIAKDLAKQLKADIDEIVDLTDRSGIKGWIFGGKDVVEKNSTEIKFSKNPQEYDLVIIGTPIWAFSSTPAISTYVMKFKKQLNKVAFFITSGSSTPEKTIDYLEKIIDKKAIYSDCWNMIDLANPKKYLDKLQKFIREIKKLSNDDRRNPRQKGLKQTQ